ncbi:MAG TPA: ATP-binding protein [Acidimicrobiales bacterium]|nr:ATP-binding protein [Acidimicrobiales bacterium]
MPQRIPIRLKLTAALAIPIAALLIVATLEVLQSAREADEVREQTQLATAAIGPAGLINNLLNERNYGAADIIGATGDGLLELPIATFDEGIAETDAALERLWSDVEGRGGNVADAYLPVLDELEERIAPLRDQVTSYDGERSLEPEVTDVSDQVFQDYTAIVNDLFETNTRVALAVDDPTLRRGAELTDMATRQTDTVARLIRLMLLDFARPDDDGTTPGTVDEPTEVAEMSAAYGQLMNTRETINSLGTGVFEDATVQMNEESDATGFIPLVETALADGTVDLEQTLATVSIPEDYSLYGYPANLATVIDQQADELNNAAQTRQQWYLALAALAVIVALVVTWLVSRSITQPLRSLTRQAKEMAEHRLPDAVLDILETPLGDNVEVPQIEPVTVRTRDEVADVADALNTVQDSALDLAVEQAVLRRNIADSFVNLGRRNQNLLGRQLDFITELESNETDPDTLASLFRLDHLATRMRRNAESLLVLAGIDPPRKWAAPVRLTDVIRAALGEVEDYQRVTVRGVEPATILGSAAADLAHLCAEFIENALTFSPPDQNVDIRGRQRPDGYTLAIIDNGLGMPAADLAQANRRLAGTESFTIAPSKYLGHYVAGNLAARHGIHLQLENSPGNGITATVDLPPTLLTNEAPTGDPITDPHGTRAVATPPVEPAPLTLGEPPAAVPAGGEGGLGMAGPEPARTASGLVKRAPRNADAPAAHMPADDLLATLSGYANRRPGDAVPGTTAPARGNGGRSAPPLPSRGGPAATPAAHAGNPYAPPGSPTSGAPPRRGGPAPTPPAPAGPPPAPGLGGLPRRQPAGPGGPGRPAPAAPAPAGAGYPPAGGPAPGSAPGPARTGAPADLWSTLSSLTTGPQRAVGGGRPGGPGGATPYPGGPAPAGPPSDPSAGGVTEGGLARRVRGAQLPSTAPVSLRRGNVENAGTGTGGYGLGDRGASSGGPNGNGGATNGEGGPAKDVYSFLSSFTAGVQRGLDEARSDTRNPEDEQ